VKDRILKIINKEQLSASRFADLIQVQRSSISHILSGRNKPSLEIVTKILLEFKNINMEWLVLGYGDMYKTTNSNSTLFPSTDEKSIKNTTLPFPTQETVNKQNNKNELFQESLFEDDESTENNNLINSQKTFNKQEQKESDLSNIIDNQPIKKVFESSKDDKQVRRNKSERVIIFYNDDTFKEYSPH